MIHRGFAISSLRASPAILLILCAMVASAADDPAAQKNFTVVGVVRPLSEIAIQKNVPGDAEPMASQMAIVTIDDRVIPLLSDEGGRVFYVDPAMRGREVRLKLLTRPDFPVAEVIQVEVRHEGKWRVPQYYCDVCTIAVRFPQICYCCQGPMEFRYKPER